MTTSQLISQEVKPETVSHPSNTLKEPENKASQASSKSSIVSESVLVNSNVSSNDVTPQSHALVISRSCSTSPLSCVPETSKVSCESVPVPVLRSTKSHWSSSPRSESTNASCLLQTSKVPHKASGDLVPDSPNVPSKSIPPQKKSLEVHCLSNLSLITNSKSQIFLDKASSYSIFTY